MSQDDLALALTLADRADALTSPGSGRSTCASTPNPT